MPCYIPIWLRHLRHSETLDKSIMWCRSFQFIYIRQTYDNLRHRPAYDSKKRCNFFIISGFVAKTSVVSPCTNTNFKKNTL